MMRIAKNPTPIDVRRIIETSAHTAARRIQDPEQTTGTTGRPKMAITRLEPNSWGFPMTDQLAEVTSLSEPQGIRNCNLNGVVSPNRPGI